MKSRTVIAALSIALQLAPIGVYAQTASPAEPAPAAPAAAAIALSREQVSGVVRNFSIEHIEGRTGNQVRVYGKVFSDCADQLEIRQQSDAPRGTLGIEIVDKGGFVACQRGHGNAVCTNTPGQANTCISLSGRPDATVNIPDADVVVKLHSVDADSDRDADRYEDLGEGFSFVSRATRQARAREAARQAREQRVAQALHQVRSCRRDADELAIARSALAWLGQNRAETDANLSRFRKDLDRKELDLLKARIRRASVEELSELEESVVAIADSNCDSADAAATAMHEIAKRYVNHRDAGLDGFERARETLNRTAELSCLSETNQARVASYLRDLEVGRCSKIAEAGLSNNFLLQPCVANLMVNLQNSVIRSCSGPSAAMEGCSQAMTAMRSVQQIPQRAQQVEQQRAQLMQQMQQTFAGMNGGGVPNATPMPMPNNGFSPQMSAPLWAGGAFGL